MVLKSRSFGQVLLSCTVAKNMSDSREITPVLLKNVKTSNGTIDVCQLLRIATKLTRITAIKDLLVTKLRECPEISRYMSDHTFGRKGDSQAVSVRGAYLLLLSLGSVHAHRSCLAVGVYMGLTEDQALSLLQQLSLADEVEPDPVTEVAKCNYDTDHKREHSRYMDSMAKCKATLQALKLASELQQLVTGSIEASLQEQIDEQIERVEGLVSTKGTHCAVELLRMFGHSETEASEMASSFGAFLKAARGDYIPNKKRMYVGMTPHKVEVCLYNPTIHANMIQAAYGSFKEGGTYARCLDTAAEEERELCRRIMKVRDVGETYSKSYRIPTLPPHYEDTYHIPPLHPRYEDTSSEL